MVVILSCLIILSTYCFVEHIKDEAIALIVVCIFSLPLFSQRMEASLGWIFLVKLNSQVLRWMGFKIPIVRVGYFIDFC